MFVLARVGTRPRILVFIRAWALDARRSVRQRLARFDVELVNESDNAVAKARYRVTGDAVIVIDHRGIVRFEHRSEQSLGTLLTEAVDGSVEALGWRDHQTKLERVQWTPREWSLKSLVVGCSLAFGTGRPPRHFARGTGPIAKVEARELATPPADLSATGEWPTAIPATIQRPSQHSSLAWKKQEE
jgi:hypothetical protein